MTGGTMESKLVKILKWAGVLALVSLPILLLTMKKRPAAQNEARDEESNIFAEELTA